MSNRFFCLIYMKRMASAQLKSDDIMQMTENTISQSRDNYEKLINLQPEQLNSVLPILANEINYFQTMKTQLSFWQHISPDADIRDASRKAELSLEDHLLSIMTNVTVYNKILEFYKKYV